MKIKVQASILEDGILENAISEGVEVDVADLHVLREQNLKLASHKPYTILVTSGPFSTITREAMDLVSSKEFQHLTIAKAILVNSRTHKIISSFYLNFKKPAIRTKIFTDRVKAITWLREQRQSS